MPCAANQSAPWSLAAKQCSNSSAGTTIPLRLLNTSEGRTSPMIKETLSDADSRMSKTLEALHRDLGTIRTGRASPALLDRIPVDYYGTPTPLNQMAGISVPEARLLVIQPWDRGSIPDIEKAIMKSDLGITPSNDGAVIRIAIPPLTEDRRKQLVKVVHSTVEDAQSRRPEHSPRFDAQRPRAAERKADLVRTTSVAPNTSWTN